jgi:hypothetical protein
MMAARPPPTLALNRPLTLPLPLVVEVDVVILLPFLPPPVVIINVIIPPLRRPPPPTAVEAKSAP